MIEYIIHHQSFKISEEEAIDTACQLCLVDEKADAHLVLKCLPPATCRGTRIRWGVNIDGHLKD